MVLAKTTRFSPYQSESRSDSQQDENKNNLETIALRLQTKDQKLNHLAFDLQAVDHDYLFTLAKALDSNDVLRSLEINLSSLSRTNANALAWGIKKCETLEQVRLSFAELSEKRSSIVLSGILEIPHVISLNLCKNDIDAPICAAICNMIKNCKTTTLQRLSLENNPFGDEGAKAVAEMIAANNTIRYLNLGNNMLTETGANILQIVAKGKTSFLFEISGLLTSFKRKRDVTSSEDSEDTPPNPAKVAKKENGLLIGPSVQGAVSSMTTSDNGARSNSASGSDEGRNPTSMSIMTGLDNGYAPASSGSDCGRTSSGYAAAASSTTGSDEGRNSSLNDSDSNQGSNSAKKTTHFFERATFSYGGGKLKSEEPPSSEDSEDTPRKKRKGISCKAKSSLTFRNMKDFDEKQEAEEKAEELAKEESTKKSDALVAANRKGSNS